MRADEVRDRRSHSPAYQEVSPVSFQQPDVHLEQPAPPSGPAAPAPPAPPRKTTGWKIAVILLSVGLLLSIVGGIGGIVAVSAVQEERIGNVQRELNVQNAAVEAEKTAESELRKKFTDQKFEAHYQKVREASTKQKQALDAWLRFEQESPQEDKAFSTWQATIQTCMTAVTDYNLATKNYPPDWFSAAAPPVADLVRTDIQCYSWRE
jgi:hypothetical protein